MRKLPDAPQTPLRILLLGSLADTELIRILGERINAEPGMCANVFSAPHDEASYRSELTAALNSVDVSIVCMAGAIPPRPHALMSSPFPSHAAEILDVLEGVKDHGRFVVPLKLGPGHLLQFNHWSTPVVNLYERRGFSALLRVLRRRATRLGYLVRDQRSPASPLRVFFSYSHKDEALRDRLERHLSVLKRQGLIQAWHDRQIDTGDIFGAEISAQLESAQLILLLISANFLASDYCWSNEMIRALQRHEAGEAIVIPVIGRACDWTRAPFARILAVPDDGEPITSSRWGNADTALAQVARRIRGVVESFRDPLISDDPLTMPGIRTSAEIEESRIYPRIFEPDCLEFKSDLYPSDYISVDIYGAGRCSREIYELSGYTNNGGSATPLPGGGWVEDEDFDIATPLPANSEDGFVCEHLRITSLVNSHAPSKNWRVESFFYKAHECAPTYFRYSEPFEAVPQVDQPKVQRGRRIPRRA